MSGSTQTFEVKKLEERIAPGLCNLLSGESLLEGVSLPAIPSTDNLPLVSCLDTGSILPDLSGGETGGGTGGGDGGLLSVPDAGLGGDGGGEASLLDGLTARVTQPIDASVAGVEFQGGPNVELLPPSGEALIFNSHIDNLAVGDCIQVDGSTGIVGITTGAADSGF